MNSPISPAVADKPRRNWPVSITLGLTFLVAVTVVPVYGWFYDFSGWTWFFAIAFTLLTGIGIGSGYHRLWSHRTYEARWPLRVFLAIFGGMALQNSILVWCARHRPHHRFVDDNDKDPYSIGRGFWFAHVGWMLRDYKSGEIDYSTCPDLMRDPVVMWQHKHYWSLVWLTNLGLPMLLGWIVGDFWGMVLLAGVARLVFNHHVTFFVNSLAHMWGSRPYTDENTARDNWFIAVLTYGEGYHNFHHMFQNDYRNGIRWWQFDLNKWFINLAAGLGLAHSLRRTPSFKIQRARLAMEFKRARERLEQGDVHPSWRERIEQEYAEFMETVRRWQALQAERMELGKRNLADRVESGRQHLAERVESGRQQLADRVESGRQNLADRVESGRQNLAERVHSGRQHVEARRQQLVDRWERTALRTRYKELEFSLKLQRKRMAVLVSQLSV